MPLSANIANGDQAVYTQYNNLRTDALNMHAQGTSLTIASGVITAVPAYSWYTLTPESGNTDDLDTITAGTGIAGGDQIVLNAGAGKYIKLTISGNIDRGVYITNDHPTILRYNGATSKWDVVKHSGCGWKALWLPISAFTPLNTGGCGSIQELDGQKVRSFSASADQSGVVALRFPSGWAGILKGKVDWIVNDTNAGNVVWVLSSENAAAGEVLGNAASVTFAVSAAGETQYEHSLTAISGELAAGADGELINLTLTRDQDHANETYATAAYAVGVMVYYLMYNDGIEEV